MRAIRLVFAWVVAAACAVAARADTAAWQARPSWLANPSPGASVSDAPEGGVRFAVPEAGRGMKWQRALQRVWLSEQPWLVVRYRASGLLSSGDYFIWLHAKRGFSVMRLDQLSADGRWHTLAVDAGALTGEESPDAVALQVQAGGDGAWVEMAWLAFMEAPPPEAEIPGGATPVGEDVALAERLGTWQPHPTWLPNPARRHRHQAHDGTYRFEVGDAGRGMKWAAYFDEPVDPTGYRYLSLRIRGRGTAIVGDYTICVLGDAAPDGQDATVLAPAALSVTYGRWRTVDLPLGPARRHQRVVGLAVQAQAWAGPARLEISDLRLTSTRRPRRLGEYLAMRPGWPRGAKGAAQAVEVGAAHSTLAGDGGGVVLSAREAQERFGLADWFPGESLLIENVPFRVRLAEGAVAATTGADESEVVVPASGRASEVYLLLVARLVGPEESVRGGGRLTRMGDSDRLRVTARYADGEERASLPAQAPPPGFGVLDGAQVVCVRADPERELREIALYVGTPQARVGIAAITLNTTTHRRHEALWAAPPLAASADAAEDLPDAPPSARLDGRRLLLANRYLEAEFDTARGLALARLLHRAVGVECVRQRPPEALFGARVGEREVGGEDFALEAAEPLREAARRGYRLTYRSAEPALEAVVALAIGEEPRVGCEIALRSLAEEDQTVEPIGPRLPPLAIGEPAEMWYLIPASATLLHSRPIVYAGWYSGAHVPLGFLDTFGPQAGGGVSLMAHDLESLEKRFLLAKSEAGVAMALDYQRRALAPGETYALAPVEIRLHTGDWHEAFQAYRDWAGSWYEPAAERPQWWREVFNFRQQFLYRFDALVDPQTGAYRMKPVLERDARDFGGVDFLHIFDWGYQRQYGRIYSRTGDHDAGPYLPGGWEDFRAAVEEVRSEGIPVGFYIEGYLLDERGLLGEARGREWQMVGPDGTPVRWPDSHEIYVCPAVEAWQEVQASTYARVVERMDADGMYLDQFGFAGPAKWCWSLDHGHRAPSSSLRAEQALTRRVREAVAAVKPGVVLYTEDTPTDVNSQYQDGAFCYSMQRHRWSGSAAPLKLFRFAFPDFKNIEILNCDHPTATWAAGVRWAFWNGEALWLEGAAEDWFAPQTRRAIRDCYRVLRAHRDAFAGDRAEPLLPTPAGGVYANGFFGAGETAYTLYNARRETYSGEVLSVAHEAGTRYWDAFTGREIQPRLAEGRAVLALTLDPQGVGCIVSRPAG